MVHELKIICKLFIGVVVTIYFCVFLIYYVIAIQCNWPQLKFDKKATSNTTLRALIFSDTHLVGPRESPWFIKCRREWQLHQAFRSIVNVHNPEVIFVLGDLFNDAAYSPAEQFRNDVERFFTIFPMKSKMHVVAGMQDVGFHDWLLPGAVERFDNLMNASEVKHLYLKGSNIILLNSIALTGDSCKLCTSARKKIDEISDKFNNETACEEYNNCSRPVIMQHLPFYRKSDAICTGPDLAPYPDRVAPHFQNLTVLSKDSSKYLAIKLKPRAVFGAHNHYGCYVNHTFHSGNETIEIAEVSVSAFNWRYRQHPRYILVTMTPDELSIRVCDLPTEFVIALSGFLLLIATVIVAIYDELKAYICGFSYSSLKVFS